MLKRLARSSTFRLALVYMTVFAASVVLLFAFLWQVAVGPLMDQVDEAIRADVAELGEQYASDGLNRVVDTISSRLERSPDGSAVYLLTGPLRLPIVGNLGSWPDTEPDGPGWVTFRFGGAASGDRPRRVRARLLALDQRVRLLVGREVDDIDQTRRRLANALVWGLAATVVLALGGGVVLSRRTMRRIEAINQTSREIMTGDLSRRIPVRGSNDDFDDLAANLNEMLDRIQSLMDGLRHVSDNIAHDLRTPLSRLRNRLERVSGDLPPDDARGRGVAGAIAEVDGLIAVFNALLRIAQIEAGGRRGGLGPVDLGALARDVAELYEPLAEDRGLRLSLEAADGAVIDGDRDLLFQAVANIVDNAVKYTPPGGEVGVAAGDGRIVVRDTGPGVPAGLREAVFERFRRLNPSRSEPGSGLGLALAQAVVRLHGGAIELADNGPGLRVTVSLGRPARGGGA